MIQKSLPYIENVANKCCRYGAEAQR